MPVASRDTMPTTSRYRSIAITGASAGLGAALARAYAGPGRHLHLFARRVAALDDVASSCRDRGARVVATSCDVTDHDALRAALLRADDGAPVDLFIANAGIFDGHRPDATGEPLASQLHQVGVNLTATIAAVDAMAQRMCSRRSGRIAIVSSLAALHALADAPAYTASKAGIAAYGEALREHLLDHGVGVSIIYPGHIDTAQIAGHVGALPQLLSADAAAARIVAGLEKGRGSIAFPRRLHWLIRAGRLVPWRLRALLGRPSRFRVAATASTAPRPADHERSD